MTLERRLSVFVKQRAVIFHNEIRRVNRNRMLFGWILTVA